LLGLLLLIPLRDTHLINPQLAYSRARDSFVHGDLQQAQIEAERGYAWFRIADPTWASKFQLVEAEAMLQRGMFNQALQVLSSFRSDPAYPDLLVRKLAIESVAFVRGQDLQQAKQKLLECRNLCQRSDFGSCGEAMQAGGILAARQGDFEEARSRFLETHAFAQSHQDAYLNASAELNLGWISLQMDRPEDALSWLMASSRVSRGLGAEDLIEKSSGNLGWAYFKVGDSERALELFLEAEKSASRRGNVRSDLGWNATIGSAYRSTGQLDQAAVFYKRALYLARQLNGKEDIINALEDLTHLSIDGGKLAEAERYLDELEHQLVTGTPRLDAVDAILARGRIAAAKHEVQQAEQLLRAVEKDADSLTSMRLDAEYELAKLYEADGNHDAAGRAYETALDTYASARATLTSEESELPFGANASRIYDSFIHLMMQEGRTQEALATADESRAGALEKGLDVDPAKGSRRVRLNPRQIAQRADATLLFYWLGEKQSYLWAITPARIAAFTLPPRQEIADQVKNYGKKIIALRDPQRTGDRDGESLYRMLVAPAAVLIEPKKQVIILADGELNQLNFETLLAPDRGGGPVETSGQDSRVHYLIDDMTLVSAPSLAMLKAPKRMRERGGKMLLLGDPVSAGEEFPSLPLFGFEMKKIESHFDKDRMAVIAGQQATPARYLASNPVQYSYIHFVSHAIASRTVPLDSAIVLSKSSADENSFKLYARDIIQHPIDAKLVTISACYGNGTRFYAGEGLVGLSWAFMHAGAQRVIGALWEVSDESTPRLMDGLYRGIEEGDTPAVSLRKAKLALLHSQSRYSLPFYWATFQIYDRQ
jgi:CHAT domain-containing protein